jgi:outer membrane protein OmpA-like peptidoglycan-associated protein
LARLIIPIILFFMVMVVHRDCLAAADTPGSRQSAILGPSFSLTPTAGMFIFDSHSNLEAGPTLGVRLGYDVMGKNATDSLGVELGVDVADTKSKTGNSSVSAYLMRVEAFYSLIPRARFVPSFVAGFGGIMINSDTKSNTSGFFDYGASAKYFLTDYLALRADLRHILAYQDVVVRSNFESTFGLLWYMSYDKSLKRVPPLDTDGDKVPDYLDKCPDTPKGVRVDKDGCPVDNDGDGVPDYLDICPNTPNGVKVDMVGCPLDSDGNGVPDYLNKCLGTPRGVKVGMNGCPAKNVEPRETGAAAPKQSTAPPAGAEPVKPVKEAAPVVETPVAEKGPAPKSKEVPLLDSDGDGVPDYLDKCPGTPKGVAVDKDGCPTAPLKPERVESEPIAAASAPTQVPAPAPVPVPARVVTERKGVSAAGYFTTVVDRCPPLPEGKIVYDEKPLKRLIVYFKTDKADIGNTFNKRILEISEYMKRNPNVFAHVEGHADYTGPFDYNVTLSRVRAINIKNQILRNGDVDPARVSIGAYGCAVPVADNRTEEGRRKNRRGVTVITLTEADPAIVK